MNMTHLLRIASIIILLAVITGNPALSQYSKNMLLPIEDEGYQMTIQKFVQLPNEGESSPRINSMSFTGSRLFASTEGGKIYEIVDNEAVLFFDVSEAIPENTGRELVATGNWHSGLRSIAFHPEFNTNGKFYTSLMEERPADVSSFHYLSDVTNPIEADGVVVEWTYDTISDEVVADSYRGLFRVGVPYFDHTIKQIMFNRHAQPEDEDYGLLYIGHGDGNPYFNPAQRGQNNDARGKILRIDPLQTDSTAYSVPATNPFVNDPDWIDEIYATGMRNPHSLCFTKAQSGEVFLISGNAGRDNIEEINVVYKGENYGWSDREGTYVQLAAGGLNTGIEALPDNEAEMGYTYPAAQWSRSAPLFSSYSALSIVGGYDVTVEETGEHIYLSADFPQSGIILYNEVDALTSAVTKLDPAEPSRDTPEELTQAPFKVMSILFDDDSESSTPPVEYNSMRPVITGDPDHDESNRSDVRFGQDADANVYIMSKRNGWIYKILSVSPPQAIPDAIATVDVNREIEIFPNPVTADGNLSVAFNNVTENHLTISLIDAYGKKVYEKTMEAGNIRYEIELGKINLSPGYYLFRIISGDTIKTGKLNIL